MGKTVACIEQAIRAAHGIEVSGADALATLRDHAVWIAHRVVKDRREGKVATLGDLEVLIQARRELTIAFRDVPRVIDDAIV